MRGVGVLTLCGLVLLAGCGERFPFGERLVPASYGPPFGDDLYRPKHPHIADGERYAATLTEESRHYSSHGDCNDAMRRLLAAPGDHHHGPVRLSSIESVGHHEAHGIMHEYRCNGAILSQRGWRTGAHGEEQGEGHAPAH